MTSIIASWWVSFMLVLFVVDVLCYALYLNDVCIGFVWKSLGNFAEPGNRCYGVKCCFSIEGYSDIILWFLWRVKYSGRPVVFNILYRVRATRISLAG